MPPYRPAISSLRPVLPCDLGAANVLVAPATVAYHQAPWRVGHTVLTVTLYGNSGIGKAQTRSRSSCLLFRLPLVFNIYLFFFFTRQQLLDVYCVWSFFFFLRLFHLHVHHTHCSTTSLLVTDLTRYTNYCIYTSVYRGAIIIIMIIKRRENNKKRWRFLVVRKRNGGKDVSKINFFFFINNTQTK